MISPRFLRFSLLPLVLISVAASASDAHTWLAKMEEAARTLNYEGVFVYHHGNMVQTLRIVHRVEDGKAQERLVSLSGAPREIIRTDDEVRCYLPDENSVMIEHRRADNKGFPRILPQRLEDLDKHYVIELARTGRVADRDVQRVVVRPRDAYRYGYHLWADQATGLLLRADLVDHQDRMVEQFVFTSIRPGISIPESDLKPRFRNKNSVWYRGEEGHGDERQSWEAAQVPPGFTLQNYLTRRTPSRQKSVEHLVYSDGLAAVSVFVEKAEKDGQSPATGPNRMGALHAYVKVVDGQRVTVVGEVPAVTVGMIGDSVRPRAADSK